MEHESDIYASDDTVCEEVLNKVLGCLLKALYSATAYESGHQPGPTQPALSRSFQFAFLRQQTATLSYPLSFAPAPRPFTSPCRPTKQVAQPKNIID
ncbi:TPA: hypothetical protein ACH3X1_003626 [Trebouxia sp. C0004]